MRRGPQTLVRAKRSTPRAGRAEDSSAAFPELKRAKSLGRTDRDQPTRWRTHESRPNGRMLSKGFSAGGPAPPSEPGQTRVSHRAPQAPRVLLSPRTREGYQPHARKYVDLSDFGTIRSRSANEARPTRTDRTGACFPSASARAAQRHRPSVRKRKSPTARRRRRASFSSPLPAPPTSAQTCRNL